VVITGLLEHLRNMILDFVVTDNQLKTLLKHQREKVGDSRVVQWIDFFYDQLQYIRDYPMEYTLVIDLITIKLIDTLRTRVEAPATRKKKEDKEEVAKTEITPSAPVIEAPAPVAKPTCKMDMAQITKLQGVTGGIIQSSTPTFTRITLKDRNSQMFDIVANVEEVISDYYYLYTDIDGAVSNPPTSIISYKKIKSALSRDLVYKMAGAVGGTVFGTANANCVTIKDANGREFDVTVTDKDAISPFYFLCEDIGKAIEQFPSNMNKYIKARA